MRRHRSPRKASVRPEEPLSQLLVRASAAARADIPAAVALPGADREVEAPPVHTEHPDLHVAPPCTSGLPPAPHRVTCAPVASGTLKCCYADRADWLHEYSCLPAAGNARFCGDLRSDVADQLADDCRTSFAGGHLSRPRCSPYQDRSLRGRRECSPGAPPSTDSGSRSTRIRSPC
jgi:hypothetical protein